MHQVADALDLIGQKAYPFSPRLVRIEDSLGCHLAAPVCMDIDSPPFDRALLDGFAVRSLDALAGAQLHIIGRHDAGGPVNCCVAQGQCVAINTGAPMPQGADAVAMVEWTSPVRGMPDYIQLTNPVTNGAGVQPQGHDARAGQVVLEMGMELTPAALAVAAAAGAHHISVNPLPRVAVLVTGDELVPIAQRPGMAEIRNTNSIMLTSLVRQYGRAGVSCEILDLGVARDESTMIRSALTRGFSTADVVLVSGGMSMGTRDLVPRLLVELGVQIHVQKVRIKPGKPFIFGTLDTRHGDAVTRKYAVGLPGNPVSAFVCFKRFVEPLLRVLQGLPMQAEFPTGICRAELPPNDVREFYQPCMIDDSKHPPVVTPLAWKGSADIYTLAKAQGLIIHPAHAPARPAGSVVDILYF